MPTTEELIEDYKTKIVRLQEKINAYQYHIDHVLTPRLKDGQL